MLPPSDEIPTEEEADESWQGDAVRRRFPQQREAGPMPDRPIELSIDVPPETKRAIERAAAEQGMTVTDFLEKALRRCLVETGYIDEDR